jgi:hypothetical protein
MSYGHLLILTEQNEKWFDVEVKCHGQIVAVRTFFTRSPKALRTQLMDFLHSAAGQALFV